MKIVKEGKLEIWDKLKCIECHFYFERLAALALLHLVFYFNKKLYQVKILIFQDILLILQMDSRNHQKHRSLPFQILKKNLL